MTQYSAIQKADSAPDAIVIGGGPVGSYAALNLAKLGIKVTVFEEHPEIGFPSHCAGHLSIRSLSAMGLYPLPKGIVENTFQHSQLLFASWHKVFTSPFPSRDSRFKQGTFSTSIWLGKPRRLVHVSS